MNGIEVIGWTAVAVVIVIVIALVIALARFGRDSESIEFKRERR